ncbi:hypothetical protein KY338_04675 [Candidatus Woesearchaeota archaeon]|nr:hypothetical protein [Candidatus Woesearchaeota archaeon]MBW3006200.1 hypothetical protein [Candidatus Woesearchaeota archaeon]
MRKKMNVKASAAALVLVSLLAVVAGALFTLHSYDKFEVDRSRQNEISTEAAITLSRAISLGINDFALNGFSKNNKYWYCNYPLPPYTDEANESVDWFVNERIRNYIQALREQGKFVNMPDIKNDVAGLEITGLNMDSISYDVSNYIVGVESDEFTEKQDISSRYTNPFKVWLMYNNFYDWMRDNAGHLTENIYTEVFENKACQAISTDCDCPGSENGRFIKNATIDEMKLEIEDVYPALDKSLEELNAKFEGTGITCEYRIEKYHIENEEKIDYSYAADSYLDQGKTDTLDWDQVLYNYEYKIWYDDFTLPNPGQDELGGCPTTDPEIDATYREQRINLDVDVDETESVEFEDGTCTSNVMFELFHVEEFALNKKLGLLLTYSCSDPSVSIESPDGLKPFTGEVGLRVSVRMDCPTPSLTKVNGNDENSFICGGGGGSSCFPAGTKVLTPGGEVNIEDVEVGQVVIAYDLENDRQVVSRVSEIESPVREGVYVINDGLVEVTDEHPFRARKKDGTVAWAAIDKEHAKEDSEINEPILGLEIGDFLFTSGNSWAEVESMVYVPGAVQTYNLKQVDFYNNFFADNLLVHNKHMGVEGDIFCPIECPECQMCAMDGDGWICIPVLMGTSCGEDVCMICDDAGACTLPAPQGMPDDCPGDCMVCDGVNMGVEACILGEGGLAEDYACSVPCYVCSADAVCDKIPEDFSEIDSSLCGDCQTCGLVNGLPACMPDVEEDGDQCGAGACQICENGACVQADDGFKDTDCDICEVCVTGDCGYSAQFSGSLDECGTCQACGEENGEAACVADPVAQGKVCGGNGCSTCQGTECLPDSSTAGNLCATDGPCETRCSSEGYCDDGSSTRGTHCDAGLDCMSGVCQEDGNCGVPASFYGKQCCGDILCNAGDPCCPHGDGIGQWTCSACDDITT